jgi:hypothetical protein
MNLLRFRLTIPIFHLSLGLVWPTGRSDGRFHSKSIPLLEERSRRFFPAEFGSLTESSLEMRDYEVPHRILHGNAEFGSLIESSRAIRIHAEAVRLPLFLVICVPTSGSSMRTKSIMFWPA